MRPWDHGQPSPWSVQSGLASSLLHSSLHHAHSFCASRSRYASGFARYWYRMQRLEELASWWKSPRRDPDVLPHLPHRSDAAPLPQLVNFLMLQQPQLAASLGNCRADSAIAGLQLKLVPFLDFAAWFQPDLDQSQIPGRLSTLQVLMARYSYEDHHSRKTARPCHRTTLKCSSLNFMPDPISMPF